MDDSIDRHQASPPRPPRYARLDTRKPLERDNSTRPPERQRTAPPGAFLEFDVRELFGHIRRNYRVVVLAMALGLAAALAVALFVPAKYTVTTGILIDPTNLRVVQDDLYAVNDQRDALVLNVESKMQVLTSTNVLAQVVEELDLAADPEFVPPPGFSLSALLPSSGESLPPETIALQNLSQQISATRDEQSFLVNLVVTTKNPEKSVQIAKALMSAFQHELARADAEGASRASQSLVGRLAELRDQVTAAEQETERFRAEHQLQFSGGELVSTQSLTQLKTQVAEAREREIQALARYAELTKGSVEGQMNAAAQESPTLSALRAQYATLVQEVQNLSQTLGPRHPRYKALLPQVSALEAEIDSETVRIVTQAATEYQQAKASLTSLESEAAAAQANLSTDNAAAVRLRELERNAASVAAVYEAFLSRSRELAEREQVDVTNVRVISDPILPRERSFPPRTVYLVILGLAFGAALGAAAGLLMGLFGWTWRGWRPTRTVRA